jgi:hypothetical protein
VGRALLDVVPMTASTPEDAVRRYLEWLEDPDSLIDDEAVARAEAAVADARDPLTRLHALADAEHARQADADAVIRDFITHARAYAEAQSIPIAAFRAVGVSDDVLRQAGFGIAGRTAAARGPRGARAGAPRAKQVSVDELKAAALGLPKRFTLADLSAAAGGGSPATVRRAVDEMISAGKVRKLGPKPDHQGPGRAPTLYELV